MFFVGIATKNTQNFPFIEMIQYLYKVKQTMENKLIQFITHKILRQPDAVLDLNTPLLSGGVIDSFSLIDLSFFIENEFGVHLEDTDLNAETFDTLAELVDLIRAKTA